MLKNQSTSNAVVSFNSREAASHAPFLQFVSEAKKQTPAQMARAF